MPTESGPFSDISNLVTLVTRDRVPTERKAAYQGAHGKYQSTLPSLSQHRIGERIRDGVNISAGSATGNTIKRPLKTGQT